MSKIITRKYIQRITKREGDTSIRRNSGGGGGGGGVSQYWVDDNYVSKEFFNRLFEIHDENGEPILPNDVETEIDNIQAMFGFWTNAYLSALGQNEGGGGAELTLASLADVAVQGVTDGQALVWSASRGKWVPGEGGGGLDPTAMWAELATTGTQQINKTHLTTALSDFVTIDTAQTISGIKIFSNTVYLNAILEPSDGNGLLVYKPASGWSGISSTQWGVGSADSQGVIRSSNTNLLHYKGGTSYTIWDASNDGAGSGLDADLLDGHHAADFALASAITDMATQTWVSTNYLTKTDANNTYLSIAFFRALFRAYTSGGSEVVPNGGSTSTIDNIKAMFGFWTNSYLSALGNNPGGSSLTLSSLSDVSISGATAGQVLTYRNGTWRNETPQGGGGLDPTAMWAELATTGTQQINKTHLTTALSDFVTIDTAQTISGAKTFSNTVYLNAISEPSASNGLLVYKPASGWSGISSTQWGVGAADSQGVIRSSNTNLLHYKGGTSYTIWDASNDGVGSGLDADLLDGHHAADFALASAITDMATQTWVSTNYLTKTDANNTYLSIAFFRALFRAYTSGGSEVVPNGGSTSTIDNIKAMFGFWTEKYISALGKGSSGSSGISIETVWTALANSDSSKQINASHLTNALAGYNPTSNFKTINGNSIIGTGDIAVSAGTGTVTSIVTGGATFSPTNGVVTLPNYIVYTNDSDNYLNASFLKAEYSQKAAQKYIEFWDSAGGWFNFMLGTLYATGNVGIGTTSPSYKLHVSGTCAVDAGLYKRNADSYPLSLYRSTDSNKKLDIYVHDVLAVLDASDSDGWSSFSFRTNGTEYVRFNGLNQYVGIGTGSPAYKLDVNGDVRADNFIGNFANKTVTASTLDGLSGSFTFEGNNLTTSGYDEVGIQIGSSVDKFQIIGKSGTLLVRQNNNGGTSTSGWSGWTMLPTKVFTSNQLTKTDQWYRVANLTTYGLSYVVSIRDGYYHREPTPATFIINTSYTNATITQIGRASTTPTSITKVRLVKYGNGTFHVEVYTPKLSGSSSASMSTPEVNIFNLGRENTSDGIALVHDPNDDTKWLEVDKNIASGETLIEEAEISTGTMIAGDMLLNNAQYIGWKNNAGTAQRICIGLNSDNDFLIGFTTAGSGYRTYLDGNSVEIRYGTSRNTGIYLNSSGNVGIGTTSPSYKLHVNGSISSNYVRLIDSSSNPYLQFVGSTDMYLQYYNNAMYMGAGTTNSIMINSSGNVGIGITSPAYKLDVNGDVQATNFRGNFVGNADSATKLQTARTIWGQSFDGTANVSGAITGATTISASSNVSVGGTLSVSGTSTLTGHVGIGTSPHDKYVLRANGEVYVSTGLTSHGYVTALSDIRHKEIQGDVGLTVSEVANAPSVKFLWKDRRQEGLQVGSIAQYWQKVLPEAIVEAADGELTMSYGVIALLASIANAREIVNLKREIAELKRKLQKHGILE